MTMLGADPVKATGLDDSLSLDDRYTRSDGTVLLTGVQALVRTVFEQLALDQRQGLATAAFVSGYPGSPLGGFDLSLDKAIAKSDLRARIRHVPAVNEELAAAAVWGSQQYASTGLSSGVDGVVGIWYGKGPGVDRTGDAFRHANFQGVGRHGGVLAIVGDDPSAKSSTLPNDSTLALSDAVMPILTPGSIQEVVDLGLLGIALSRYCGLWVGLKVLTNVADGFGTASLDPSRLSITSPDFEYEGKRWRFSQRVNAKHPYTLVQEREMLNGRLRAAEAFIAANGVNHIHGAASGARLGIVAAGKTWYDLLDALRAIGVDHDELEQHGIRLLQLGATWPLEPTIVERFATGLSHVLVVEEKRSFVERQLKDILYNLPSRPQVLGKRDTDGSLLVPADGELTPDVVRPVLEKWLPRHVPENVVQVQPAPVRSRTVLPLAVSHGPAFCSGCPHNRSTVVPSGSVMGGGVGCHAMVYLETRHDTDQSLALVPMGSEGVPWIGLSPFTDAKHLVQNLGDGTYNHSGSLAIRACVAAGVNITFKLLYNQAVAMTGGQAVTGASDVPAMTREVSAMGVQRIIVCAEDPHRYPRNAQWGSSVKIWSRDRMDEAQAELQAVPGVTVIIYDQRCAAESRRLRKRGSLPTPTTRVVINEAVCEGCGDCSKKSNCISLHPVETDRGRKTQVHQSSCNMDYTCLEGDCPSFVTVDSRGAAPARTKTPVDPPAIPPEVAARTVPASGFSIYSMGVGGTGVVTANQLIATAAKLEGRNVVGLDQTGLSQKAGGVAGHLKVFPASSSPSGNAVTNGTADLYLGFDGIAARNPVHLSRIRSSSTMAVLSSTQSPSAAMATSSAADMTATEALAPIYPSRDELSGTVQELTGRDDGVTIDSGRIAGEIFGDHLMANVILLGAAAQAGALPVSVQAMTRAIELNGVSVAKNLQAFAWGRFAVANPHDLAKILTAPRTGQVGLAPSEKSLAAVGQLVTALGLPVGVADVVRVRAADLVEYQAIGYAEKYLEVVRQVASHDAAFAENGWQLTEATAIGLYKFMAYKDEFEVARLHLDAAFNRKLTESAAPGARVYFHLHPPMLRAMGMKRKLRIRAGVALPTFRLLLALRRLRGSRVNVFGYGGVRRLERQLIVDYVDAVLSVSAGLSSSNYERAVAVAQLPAMVRGYESLKERRGEQFYDELQTLLGSDATGLAAHAVLPVV